MESRIIIEKSENGSLQAFCEKISRKKILVSRIVEEKQSPLLEVTRAEVPSMRFIEPMVKGLWVGAEAGSDRHCAVAQLSGFPIRGYATFKLVDGWKMQEEIGIKTPSTIRAEMEICETHEDMRPLSERIGTYIRGTKIESFHDLLAADDSFLNEEIPESVMDQRKIIKEVRKIVPIHEDFIVLMIIRKGSPLYIYASKKTRQGSGGYKIPHINNTYPDGKCCSSVNVQELVSQENPISFISMTVKALEAHMNDWTNYDLNTSATNTLVDFAKNEQSPKYEPLLEGDAQSWILKLTSGIHLKE